MVSQGRMEMDEIKRVLSGKNLGLVDIAPDGDCLYNALAHQAELRGVGKVGHFRRPLPRNFFN
jgi:hypothetical protein